MKNWFIMIVATILFLLQTACSDNTVAELTSISVVPATSSIAKTTTQQFVAMGTYSDNTVAKITTGITWASSNGDIASVNDAGLATGASIGSTTIKATSGASSGTSNLTVTDAVLISIAVTPQNPTLAFNIPLPHQQFTATGTFSDSSTQDLTTLVTWISSDTSVAIISNQVGSIGEASFVTIGTTTITAVFSGVTGSTILHDAPGNI